MSNDGDASPLVLAADTSSPRASLALGRGGRILAAVGGSSPDRHSQVFFTHLATLLRLGGVAVAQIERFAVATGPGSFTGLRVGLAAIKGLARANGLRAVGLTALDLWALTAGVAGLVLSLTHAGRGEIYGGLREVSAEGGLTRLGEDRVGVAGEVCARLLEEAGGDRVVVVGDAAGCSSPELLRLVGGGRMRVGRVVDRGWEGCQVKTDLPLLAPYLALHAGRPGLMTEAHPYYLRPTDAEIKWKGGIG